MRLLFSSTLGHGHVFPLVPLAQACLRAGHEVRWASPSGSAPLLAEAGIAHVRAGLDGPELGAAMARLGAVSSQLPPQDRAAYMFPTMFGETFAPTMAADLVAFGRSWRPDLLVHEASELGSPLAAAVLGVPSVTQSFGGAVPPAHLAEAARLVAPAWAAHGLDVSPYAGSFETLYLDLCPPSVQPIPIDHISVRKPLRPVTWSGAGTWVPLGEPFVYVTLGTVFNDHSVLRAIAESLARQSISLLVAVGPDGDPAAFGDLPGVRAERFVPQSEVLPHCSAVVSHGGSGTFLGALAAGVPQVCLPQAADQFRNASAMVRRGVGLVGDTAVSLRRVLDEPEFLTAALEVQAEIVAMPGPDEVVDLFGALT